MARVSPEECMSPVAQHPFGLISNTRCRFVVAGAMVCLLLVIILPIVLRPRKEGDVPMYTATCSLVEYTMGKLLAVSCDVKVPTDANGGIDVSRTSFALNGVNVSPVNCTFHSTEGKLACQGPMVTCVFRGTLSISLSDSGGNVVLEKQVQLDSPHHHMVTSVVQELVPVGTNLTSKFNFTCDVTSSCNAYMALYVKGTVYLTQDDATFCTNTSMTDEGYNKSCVFDVPADVILKQRSMNISCVLLNDGVVAKQQYFHLPTCSDRSSDCNCSASTSSCEFICSKLNTCLKHDAASRYQNIYTGSPPGSCQVLCHTKWCRDAFNEDKTMKVLPEILDAMCANSTNKG